MEVKLISHHSSYSNEFPVAFSFYSEVDGRSTLADKERNITTAYFDVSTVQYNCVSRMNWYYNEPHHLN